MGKLRNRWEEAPDAYRKGAKMDNNERLTMTITEFAGLTGCSRNLAFSLARKDQLPIPVIFVGQRRMVVSRAAVMALLADRKVAEKED